MSGVDDIDNLADVASDRFPLFTTLSEILYLLDSTLPGGRFVKNLSNARSSSTELSGLGAYFDMDDEDDDDDDHIANGSDSVDTSLDTSMIHQEQSAQYEMNWQQFLKKVWPKIARKDKVHSRFESYLFFFFLKLMLLVCVSKLFFLLPIIV
jgi:hypothetical protein